MRIPFFFRLWHSQGLMYWSDIDPEKLCHEYYFSLPEQFKKQPVTSMPEKVSAEEVAPVEGEPFPFSITNSLLLLKILCNCIFKNFIYKTRSGEDWWGSV